MPRRRSHRAKARARSGASLIEVLVVIGAASVLTLILIVTLRGTKDRQIDLRDLHNLRLSALDLLANASDSDDILLTVGLAGSSRHQALYGGLPVGGGASGGAAHAISYWSIDVNWNRILNQITGETHAHWQSSHGLREIPRPNIPGFAFPEPPSDPRSPAYALGPSRFLYSCTLTTRPDLWVDPPIAIDMSTIHMFFTNVRLTDVRYPAAKGMLIHPDRPGDAPRHNTAFVDGSVASIHPERFVPPVRRPLAVSNDVPGIPVLHTAEGHNGRDR